MAYIYEDANDQHVRATLVHATTDGKAYADAEATKQYKTTELVNLYKKGMVLIKKGDAYFCPVAMKVADGVCTLTYITNDSSLAAATLVSAAEE